jgi:hypothetical protein
VGGGLGVVDIMGGVAVGRHDNTVGRREVGRGR